MRKQADYIHMLTGNAELATPAFKDLLRPKQGAVVDRLAAEIVGSNLNFWTGQGDEADVAHTYHGAFLVRWHTPGEDDPQHLVVVAKSPSMEDTP